MNFPYWTSSGLSRPHSWRSSATRAGVAWLPRIVRAGSPGTRWMRKKTRIVTPSDDRHQLQQPTTRRTPLRRHVSVLIRRPSVPPDRLPEPGVLQVVVAERLHEEPVQLARVRLAERRVVEEPEERVRARRSAGSARRAAPASRRSISRCAWCESFDHRRVVVVGVERVRAARRIDRERHELVRVGDVHRPVAEAELVVLASRCR